MTWKPESKADNAAGWNNCRGACEFKAFCLVIGMDGNAAYMIAAALVLAAVAYLMYRDATSKSWAKYSAKEKGKWQKK